MAVRQHGARSYRAASPALASVLVALALAALALAALALAAFGSPAAAQIVLPPSGGSGSGGGGGVAAPGGNAPAAFTFRVCNQSSVTAAVAVMGRLDPSSPQDWVSAGWWVVGPNQCSNLTTAVWGWLYAYAEERGRGGGGAVWPARTGELAEFCVEYPGPYARVRRVSVTCDPRLLKTFRGMQVKPESGGDLYTWTLQTN